MEPLTERQAEILRLVRELTEVSGYPPTRAEIAEKMGFRSVNAAEQHLRALERKGAIEISSGASRGIRVRDGRAASRGARLLELPDVRALVGPFTAFFRAHGTGLAALMLLMITLYHLCDYMRGPRPTCRSPCRSMPWLTALKPPKDLYLMGNYLGEIGLSQILNRAVSLAQELRNQYAS